MNSTVVKLRLLFSGWERGGGLVLFLLAVLLAGESLLRRAPSQGSTVGGVAEGFEGGTVEEPLANSEALNFLEFNFSAFDFKPPANGYSGAGDGSAGGTVKLFDGGAGDAGGGGGLHEIGCPASEPRIYLKLRGEQKSGLYTAEILIGELFRRTCSLLGGHCEYRGRTRAVETRSESNQGLQMSVHSRDITECNGDTHRGTEPLAQVASMCVQPKYDARGSAFQNNICTAPTLRRHASAAGAAATANSRRGASA